MVEHQDEAWRLGLLQPREFQYFEREFTNSESTPLPNENPYLKTFSCVCETRNVIRTSELQEGLIEPAGIMEKHLSLFVYSFI